jgi:outer membrane lipoprotein SlyB
MQIAPETVGALAGGILGAGTGSLINVICSVAGALTDKKPKAVIKRSSPYKMLIPGYGSYEYMNQTLAD